MNYYLLILMSVFHEIEIIMEQDDNASRHLKQFFDHRNLIEMIICFARPGN